jgi:hypothetical protein
MDNKDFEILKEKHIEQLKQRRAEGEKMLRECWENLKPFETIQDIPELPKADEKTWKEFYIPKLIELGAIPKKDLVVGEYYIGDHRCTGIARWNGDVFEYWKWEFFPMEDECNHFEDDNGFALFVPIGIGTKEEFDKYGYDAWLKEKEKKN